LGGGGPTIFSSFFVFPLFFVPQEQSERARAPELAPVRGSIGTSTSTDTSYEATATATATSLLAIVETQAGQPDKKILLHGDTRLCAWPEREGLLPLGNSAR